MGKSVTEKIFEKHLVDGKMSTGEEVGLKIDHTLTQDSTGTMAYLEFEAMGISQVKTQLSLSFVDHNMLQNDFRNADDHRYLQSVAAKYGIVFSRPGNGICHQLYLERFAQPGVTLLGSDSHTPTAGGMGMIAIGAGGLDVAAAMAGEPFYLEMPDVYGINLTGKLAPFVSAKDVVLEVLKKLTVKGGVNKILEYFGSGVKTLSVPERGTITNMGTETGATTSIFPSDEVTKQFLASQGRESRWMELEADKDVRYSEVLDIDLAKVEPLLAMPHSPDNIKPVSELEGTLVDQVCIGSCTNSSLRDLKIVSALLRGKKVHENLSLTVSAGSRQVMENLAVTGELEPLIQSGARILENSCGPCIGIGQAPTTGAVSLRTFNRNFKGRSGTQDAKVYLTSPETAVAAAITGKITDPRKLGVFPEISMPEKFILSDAMFIPAGVNPNAKVIMGPNITSLPQFQSTPSLLKGEVLLKTGDNITTDDILPGGTDIMSLRSNIPEISKYIFHRVDTTFYQRAIQKQGGFIVGAENYGQGSSREHAALAPRYIGVKAVIVKSFARIHMANLINFGILPLTFADKKDYDNIEQGDILELEINHLVETLTLKNKTKTIEIKVNLNLSKQEKEQIKAGGKLAVIKNKQK
ncbi:MAG: aconitate hydratase [Candidatus Bathyarchaeota archaeon]|uniref:aconitate hydratase n=1 Tax=Candidatus Bathycorpusculum sp. TaxID=2994959 RepID=UPI002837539C|nr:aconitate hydratase [Candidatus Termiticorpusculum sp.]MCL2256944.1 aconitate hydratase [Candidatus Termiticorpusculum sp.]MCL2292932.1 aconitate hydratase [Candidatus Termiticorpusculum sp.]